MQVNGETLRNLVTHRLAELAGTTTEDQPIDGELVEP
jgi:hypothetical protein